MCSKLERLNLNPPYPNKDGFNAELILNASKVTLKHIKIYYPVNDFSFAFMEGMIALKTVEIHTDFQTLR